MQPLKEETFAVPRNQFAQLAQRASLHTFPQAA